MGVAKRDINRTRLPAQDMQHAQSAQHADALARSAKWSVDVKHRQSTQVMLLLNDVQASSSARETELAVSWMAEAAPRAHRCTRAQTKLRQG